MAVRVADFQPPSARLETLAHRNEGVVAGSRGRYLRGILLRKPSLTFASKCVPSEAD